MTQDPVPATSVVSHTASATDTSWVAQDFTKSGQDFLAWFAALQRTEPAFAWSALLANEDTGIQPLAQSGEREALISGVVPLAQSAAQERQLKVSVVHGTAQPLTVMAAPLGNGPTICIVAVEGKLVDAARFSPLFEAAVGQLANAIAAPAPLQHELRLDASPFDAHGLLHLAAMAEESTLAQDLFRRLGQVLAPDHAILARIHKGRVTVLRSRTIAEQLPRGSRAGQARHAALRRAAGAAQSLQLSWHPRDMLDDAELAPDLTAIVSEERVARVATLSLPYHGRRLVWLGLWDSEIATTERALRGLMPQWQRLSALLQARGAPKSLAWLDGLPRWLDPRGWRLWTALAVLAALVWLLMPAPLTVVGEATLRSSDQRALVAPRDGFLSAVHVQPGDLVKAGQVLAELDTRELTLRQSRATAQIEQAQSRRMAAMASFNTAMVQVSNAEIEALAAERDLVEVLLEQSRLVAGSDGLVVSGDMEERVGTALRHGEPMFQLAPLTGFKVAIIVPQKDITETRANLQGSLRLTALPFDEFPLVIERIALGDGQGSAPGFTAVAELDATHPAFRPGMQGVAHIVAGQTFRAWTLLRDLVFWGQLQWWRWVP